MAFLIGVNRFKRIQIRLNITLALKLSIVIIFATFLINIRNLNTAFTAFKILII